MTTSQQTSQLRLQRLIEAHANGWHDASPVSLCRDCPGSNRGGVTREPFRPSQRQTGLTEAFAGIRLDIETCVLGYSRVLMADGRRVPIQKLVSDRDPGPVASLDSRGLLVARTITGWHRTKLGSRNWVGLIPSNARATKAGGQKRKMLWLTDDHRVLTPDGWREAGSLNDGDVLISDEPAPSAEQLQVLVGTLLGDGHLTARRGTVYQRAGLQLTHATKDREWLDLKVDALKGLGLSEPSPNQGKERSWSRQLACLSKIRGSWYRPRKIVDRQAVRDAWGPLMLATWYCDDGSLRRSKRRSGQYGRPGAMFCTNGFSESDVRWLSGQLGQAGYGCSVRYQRGWAIHLTIDGAERLFADIAKYIPPVMRRKLPAGASPFDRGLWALRPAERFVDTVEIHRGRRPHQKTAYCLSVEETQMFFAGGVAVHNCAICYANRGVGDHHLVFRSAGGEEGPTLPACVSCHNCVHDRLWFLELTQEGLFVNNAEGELIWRLLRWPIAADAGEFVQMLDNVSDANRAMPDLAPAMLPWQMSEVFASLRSLGDSAWKSQSRLAGEVWRYRLPHLKPSDRIDAIAERFTLRKSQCYNLVMLDNCFPAEKSSALDETPLSLGTALEAARATDPEKWLKHAEERKLLHPQYGRGDLRAEIIAAGERKQPVVVEETSAPKMAWGKCQGCGAVNWFERLPVGAGMANDD